MKYSLAENAASSLHIALEHFKAFYYNSDEIPMSILDENIKISLSFLENAIELLLKTILVVDDETSIYVEPNCKTIKKAMKKRPKQITLSDILIKDSNVKTITYTDALKQYNTKFCNSDKVYNILTRLGETRNKITHLGIEILEYDEILIIFFNVFDVIYNYLYPQLIKLDSIGDYFISDDFLVTTVHGSKFLFDENFVYNNIVDFFDELLGDCRDYFCAMRVKNPNTKIVDFIELFKIAISDKKFNALCDIYKINVDFSSCEVEDNSYIIDFEFNNGKTDFIISRYLPYYNATAFFDEGGNIAFIVLHSKEEIYIYSEPVSYPETDEPEADEQWVDDMKKGYCEKMNLSKRNILKAFEKFFVRLQSL
ncbi:MAG: hypothetical protein IJZ89_02185 [Clostridia bacterium]|nr:hypothetical protein [Clostridia bacterium]